MRKIIPFLLFLPLLILSLSIGFFQLRSKNVKTTAISPTVSSSSRGAELSISPTSTQAVENDNQINLNITSPVSGTSTDATTITIIGSTQANVSVVINDAEITANKDGSFKTNVALDEGENYISVVAYNDLGNIAEREITITRTISGL
ncbi:MAG: hypothetical protein V1922_05025 [bacterium]